MLQDLQAIPANPSSVHFFGQKARSLLTHARGSCADFFKAKPNEILFTSGGTESINIFLRGIPKGHIVSTSIEHAAIHETLLALSSKGYPLTQIPVDALGAPLPELIENAMRSDTVAIVLSASNGETGVKLDLETIAKLAEKKGVLLFIDAVAFVGKEELIMHPGIAGMAISGHKFHGPKGVGALYLRSDVKLTPLITGGAQENGKRAGTENLAGILGMAKALDLIRFNQVEIISHIFELRKYLEEGLTSSLPDLLIHGKGERVSNTSNLAFLGLDGETLLMLFDQAGIAVSHGSACSSGSLEPSRVLTNMGVPRKIARSSIRFSLSRMNTREEIDFALEKIVQIVKQQRSF